MADKQRYVKVTFEFGTDQDGELTPVNTGDIVWLSMHEENAVGLQNYALIPALQDMLAKTGELGMMATGMIPFPEGMSIPADGADAPSGNKGGGKNS